MNQTAAVKVWQFDNQTICICTCLRRQWREATICWIMIERRLQNSPYFCAFKYARAVKQKVWNEAENRERDLGRDTKNTLALRACEARALRARKTLTACFTDFFTDFEKKNLLFCSLPPLSPSSLPFIPSLSLLKCNKIQQSWSVTIRALKINQGTKLGILKKPLFSLFDVITFWFNKKIKQLI